MYFGDLDDWYGVKGMTLDELAAWSEEQTRRMELACERMRQMTPRIVDAYHALLTKHVLNAIKEGRDEG